MKINHQKNISGFTLIELLIVIAVMAILTTVVFVALNPLARFQDARNNRRWTDVNAILSAIKLCQVDNGGLYCGEITDTRIEDDQEYMLGKCSGGTSGVSCSIPEDGTLNPTFCIDMDFYRDEAGGYLPAIPVDPSLSDDPNLNGIGYYFIRKSNGSLTIGSCFEEKGSGTAAPEISVTR